MSGSAACRSISEPCRGCCGPAQGPAGGEFIDRYVSPGGGLPHVSQVLYEIAGAPLEPIDWEDLRPHYPLTPRAWATRPEANREASIAAAGHPLSRVWRMYMAEMAYAFERGLLSVGQLLAVKPLADRPGDRPWTRVSDRTPGRAGSHGAAAGDAVAVLSCSAAPIPDITLPHSGRRVSPGSAA